MLLELLSRDCWVDVRPCRWVSDERVPPHADVLQEEPVPTPREICSPLKAIQAGPQLLTRLSIVICCDLFVGAVVWVPPVFGAGVLVGVERIQERPLAEFPRTKNPHSTIQGAGFGPPRDDRECSQPQP